MKQNEPKRERPPMMKPTEKKRILSISYDEALLTTRHMVLEQAGFAVTSALGFTESIEKCKTEKFDLVLLGHSLPIKDKAAIAECVRQHSKSRILSIRRHGYAPLPEADYSVDALEGPSVLVEAVNSALNLEPV
jgi:CheY-like chemotaxis protein